MDSPSRTKVSVPWTFVLSSTKLFIFSLYLELLSNLSNKFVGPLQVRDTTFLKLDCVEVLFKMLVFRTFPNSMSHEGRRRSDTYKGLGLGLGFPNMAKFSFQGVTYKLFRTNKNKKLINILHADVSIFSFVVMTSNTAIVTRKSL